jgi:hypothetical protein
MMIRNRILLNVLIFFSGVIAGVVGLTFYEIFGKPALPKVVKSYEYDPPEKFYHGHSGKIVKRQSDGNFLDWVEPYEYLDEADSFEAECKRMLITPLADTQPIKVR